MKTISPNWTELRTQDFICGSTASGASAYYETGSGNVSVRIDASYQCYASYDNNTGILTFGGYGSHGTGHNGYIDGRNYGTLFCAWKGTYSG